MHLSVPSCVQIILIFYYDLRTLRVKKNTRLTLYMKLIPCRRFMARLITILSGVDLMYSLSYNVQLLYNYDIGTYVKLGNLCASNTPVRFRHMPSITIKCTRNNIIIILWCLMIIIINRTVTSVITV